MPQIPRLKKIAVALPLLLAARAYASHFAATAPATNLGAATPVQIATPKLPSMPSPDDSDLADIEEKATPMEYGKLP